MNRIIKFRAWVPEEHKGSRGSGMFYDAQRAYDTLGTMGDGKGGKRDYDWNSFEEVLNLAKEGEINLMQFM